jgi:hypothetical protein
MSLKIKPQCLKGKQVAFINKGFFTPCCQIDGWRQLEPFKELGFLDEEFHISNLKTQEDISTIFESKIWQDFYNNLLENPEEAPWVCKKVCGYKDGKKIKHDKKINMVEINNG